MEKALDAVDARAVEVARALFPPSTEADGTLAALFIQMTRQPELLTLVSGLVVAACAISDGTVSLDEIVRPPSHA